MTALAAEGTFLYAATEGGELLRSRTRVVGDDKGGWEVIGKTPGKMRGLAAIEGMLYGVYENRLLRMDLHHFYMYRPENPSA